MMRPGVPTTICAPLLRARICFGIDAPPNTAAMATPSEQVSSFSNSPATWSASSRVGSRISTWGRFAAGSTFCTAGMAKARVLPVPVWERPMMSLPAKSLGMACA